MKAARRSVRHLNEISTSYSDDFYEKTRSEEDLKNSLSSGSKNRLIKYQKSLRVSRGVDKPLFDNGVYNLLKEYVWSHDDLTKTLNYLNSLRDDDGFLFSRDLRIYKKTQDAMERFGEANHTSFRWNRNYTKALEKMRDEVKHLRLRPERYFSDDEILHALPKVDTHSGFTWILTGSKEKGDNIEGIYNKFQGRQNMMMKGVTIPGQPILLAFRTQASGEFDDYGQQTHTCKHKTRVVSMYDLLDIVDELQFANPFQRWINEQTWYAGGKDDNKIARIISMYSGSHAKFMSIDYSSFDQTISDWLIEDAFSVIRAAFLLTHEQECIFNNVVNRFIHKDFLLDRGIYHCDKGVPSGSRFTQMIDSIVNRLVVLTFFNSINEECDMIIMGDDNAIFCSRSVELSNLASYAMKNFGLVVKLDDKSNEGLTTRQDVKFLSRYWTKGGSWRHPHQLISRMLFPERWRDYKDDIKPEHVLFAYILTYRVGMAELMDVNRFIIEHPISRSFVMNNVDSRYLPGSMAYIREYTA